MWEKKAPYLGEHLSEFNHIWNRFNYIYHEAAVRLQISDSVFMILYSICELGDGCLQKEICYVSGLPKQTVNSSIRNLEKEGYLTLEKGKGRSMKICLTEKGTKMMEEKMFPVLEAENKAFLAMTEEECELLLNGFRKYCLALETDMKGALEENENTVI